MVISTGIQFPYCTTATARLGQNASKGSDASGKVWSVYLSEAERVDRALAENWKGDTEGILIFVRIVLSDPPPTQALTFVYPRLVSLLLPWQHSSLRATSNCPLIPPPQLSSFYNRYPTNFPRRAALPPPPLDQSIAIYPFERPRPPFALTSSGSSV